MLEKNMNGITCHVYVGFGSPIHLHSNTIFLPSSDCRVTGRSVKAGLKPSAGTGTSSPVLGRDREKAERREGRKGWEGNTCGLIGLSLRFSVSTVFVMIVDLSIHLFLEEFKRALFLQHSLIYTLFLNTHTLLVLLCLRAIFNS